VRDVLEFITTNRLKVIAPKAKPTVKELVESVEIIDSNMPLFETSGLGGLMKNSEYHNQRRKSCVK
jgi:hypothetical protein